MSKEKEANLPQRGERALIISVNVASLTRHTSIYRSRYTRNWIENKNSENETYTNCIIVIIIIQISRKLVSHKELNFHRYINNFLFAEITCGKKSFLLHTDAFNEVFNATVAFRWKHEVLANHSSNVTLRLLFHLLILLKNDLRWDTISSVRYPTKPAQFEDKNKINEKRFWQTI